MSSESPLSIEDAIKGRRYGKTDGKQTFLGRRARVDLLPVYKYLFGETILDMREFYPEGEDIGMYHLRRRLSEVH